MSVIAFKGVEVELTILGSMLMDEEFFYRCVAELRQEDFANSDYRELFRFLKEKYEKGLLYEQVVVELEENEKLEQTAGLTVEYAIDNRKILNALIEKLIEQSKKRKEFEVAKKLSTGEITREEALALLADLERDRSKKGGSVSEVAKRWIEKVEEQQKSDESPGITTGSAEIDSVFTYRNELSLICARPSIGKTITALKLAYNQAKEGIKVLFFSLELTEDEVMSRLVSINTGVPLYKVVYGWLDMKMLVEAASYISELPIYIEPGPLSLPQIKAKIYETKPDIVYIDYVQKVTNHSKEFKSRKDFLDYVSAELLEIAKRTCPIVALAQLNRGARMGRDEPTVENIKETGNFEQDASNILLLHRNLKESPDRLQVKIAKCRVNAANKEVVVDFVNGIPVFTPPGVSGEEFGYEGEYENIDF
jgi:replicative DNA helicase